MTIEVSPISSLVIVTIYFEPALIYYGPGQEKKGSLVPPSPMDEMSVYYKENKKYFKLFFIKNFAKHDLKYMHMSIILCDIDA